MKTNDVLIYFGSKAEIGRVLGVSKSAISQWGNEVPPLRAYQIEQITKGKLSANLVEHKQAS